MLESCRECRGPISTTARAFPRCGAPGSALDDSPPDSRLERDLATIKRDVMALRRWLITAPLVLAGLYLAYYLIKHF